MLDRLRTAAFRTALAIALAAIVVGGVDAYLGYRQSDGPTDVVRGYFAALARGDAAAALGYADAPDGSHTFLTADVLAVQRRLAPITDIVVGPVHRSGDAAAVGYSYRLGDARTPTAGTLVVHRESGTWRLARAAVPVRLHLARASDRASLAGARLPSGSTLLFPGAVPVSLDAAYLRLVGLPTAGFARPASLSLHVEITAAGRNALRAALATRLAECFSAGAHQALSTGDPTSGDPTCPAPTGGRVVPGSLRGTLGGNPVAAATISVSAGPTGDVDLAATASFTGRYRRLDFENLPQPDRGTLPLHFRAVAVPAAPARIVFVGAS